ncbi:pseudouridine synthase [Vibrio ponticus]|uniref:Pseudouridine synthase n=1 Tax=Vibrio ponticus TaxID=265668 RepID=A0A3N3DZG2_9VIBR|nr:YqcC family protein [Vibrio ponticus]OLQ89330.1 pseudouridine synthase [Vibrio ponticus]ROV59894.1 YqcC family protein [Vibrio ponticus]
MKQDTSLTVLLNQLEQQLREVELWQDMPPSAQALASEQPFAIDTLEPHEWLQWIFLPKMRQLIEAELSLPQGFAIAPYFEECWKQHTHYVSVITVIRQIDSEAA